MAALGGTCGSGIVLLLAVLSLIAVGADAVLCPAAKITGEAHPRMPRSRGNREGQVFVRYRGTVSEWNEAGRGLGRGNVPFSS